MATWETDSEFAELILNDLVVVLVDILFSTVISDHVCVLGHAVRRLMPFQHRTVSSQRPTCCLKTIVYRLYSVEFQN